MQYLVPVGDLEDVVQLLNISSRRKVIWDTVDKLDEGGERVVCRSLYIHFNLLPSHHILRNGAMEERLEYRICYGQEQLVTLDFTTDDLEKLDNYCWEK